MSLAMLEHETGLVIDLSAEVRDYVASILRQQFQCQRILLASNRDEALELLRSGTERIDWIFYDWELPRLDPTVFLGEVRKYPGSRAAAVIIMTRHREKPVLQAVLDAGANDYLIKPFTLSILVFKVRRIRLAQERREGERLQVHASQEVGVRFVDAGENLAATLVSISSTGCLARTPCFPSHAASIYADADIVLQTEEGPVELRGELVRVEGDRGVQPSRTHVLAAFRFHPLSRDHEKRLAGYIAAIGPPQPSDWTAA
jgi:CheY-like chemotaxis protein